MHISVPLLLVLSAWLASACGGRDVASPPTGEIHTLTISVTGEGRVTVSPSRITCSTGNTGRCSATFATGTQVTLTATSTSGWLFGGWSGACSGTGSCVVSVTVDQAVTATFTPAGTITTVAGTEAFGFGGDGGPATQANLTFPDGVALDAGGNLYIADSGNRRVRKVDPTGIITTVAGIGESGFSGDGGPATQARLAGPADVALDAGGTLYIADSGNHRVRKVDPAGIITTVAGTGESGFSGDGEPAAQARLASPTDVALDAGGNLYIVDRGNHRVRKVDPAGIITTVAGSGPASDDVDDQGGFSGDGGPATQARFRFPAGLALDAGGNLYIVDSSNHRVRKVDPTGIITTVAGSGPTGSSNGGFSGDGEPAALARLNNPRRVALDAGGNLYIADSGNRRVRKVDLFGIITTVAGTGERGFSGDGGPATQAQLSFPNGVALDAFGALYISDSSNHRIRKVSP